MYISFINKSQGLEVFESVLIQVVLKIWKAFSIALQNSPKKIREASKGSYHRLNEQSDSRFSGCLVSVSLKYMIGIAASDKITG